MTNQQTPVCERRLMDPAALLASAERRSVALCDLRVDPHMSCRNRIHDGRVRLMTEALRTGQELEPLVVALIDNAVTLIDGHHRYRALVASDAGRTDVLVLTNVTDREEARWLAFWLHWCAALPLTRKERRGGFRAFVEARHHLATKFGRVKTYEMISADLGIASTTIWRWMQQDFPHVAAKMSRMPEDDQRPSKAMIAEKRAKAALAHHIAQIALIAREGKDRKAEAREALIKALRNCGDQRPLSEVLTSPASEYDF